MNTNKELLKKMAREINFQSALFADEFKFSNKEDLRFYLWMCELNRFLIKKGYISMFKICLDETNKNLCESLINIIRQSKVKVS